MTSVLKVAGVFFFALVGTSFCRKSFIPKTNCFDIYLTLLFRKKTPTIKTINQSSDEITQPPSQESSFRDPTPSTDSLTTTTTINTKIPVTPDVGILSESFRYSDPRLSYANPYSSYAAAMCSPIDFNGQVKKNDMPIYQQPFTPRKQQKFQFPQQQQFLMENELIEKKQQIEQLEQQIERQKLEQQLINKQQQLNLLIEQQQYPYLQQPQLLPQQQQQQYNLLPLQELLSQQSQSSLLLPQQQPQLFPQQKKSPPLLPQQQQYMLLQQPQLLPYLEQQVSYQKQLPYSLQQQFMQQQPYQQQYIDPYLSTSPYNTVTTLPTYSHQQQQKQHSLPLRRKDVSVT